MTADEALTFVERRGLVLVSARGPVPRLTEAIVNEPVSGSWWSHPRSREIFAVLRAVTQHADVLLCRLIGGRQTLVHRRLWPALIRVSSRVPVADLAAIREVHTAQGHHENVETPFPDWVPADVHAAARALDEPAADALLRAAGWSPLGPQ